MGYINITSNVRCTEYVSEQRAAFLSISASRHTIFPVQTYTQYMRMVCTNLRYIYIYELFLRCHPLLVLIFKLIFQLNCIFGIGLSQDTHHYTTQQTFTPREPFQYAVPAHVRSKTYSVRMTDNISALLTGRTNLRTR